MRDHSRYHIARLCVREAHAYTCLLRSMKGLRHVRHNNRSNDYNHHSNKNNDNSMHKTSSDNLLHSATLHNSLFIFSVIFVYCLLLIHIVNCEMSIACFIISVVYYSFRIVLLLVCIVLQCCLLLFLL